MSKANASQRARFDAALSALAADPAGWSGPAGAACVEVIGDALADKAGRLDRSRDSFTGADVVAEAVLVISGTAGTELAESIERLQAMESPLAYVIGSVSRNLDREVLSERMGVGARQVGPETRAVGSLESVREDVPEALEVESTRAPWARRPVERSQDADRAAELFFVTMTERFGARPQLVRGSMGLASDVAVAPGRMTGATSQATARRLSEFAAAAAGPRGLVARREQIASMGALIFGSIRHPEWSLYGACARAAVHGEELRVSAWHTRHARTVAARMPSTPRVVGVGVQQSLFEVAAPSAGRAVRVA